ncbi:MAG: AAA family ATPase [Fusobacteriaceae bacterium]
MVKKKLPVGVDDFKKIIEDDYYFVDKSMFIDELLNKKSEVTLLPRPRRFGKTLNMSMLNYFFSIEGKDSNKELFDDLDISKTDKMKYLGEYPVIYISLKDIKVNNWELCLEKISSLIKKEYKKYGLVLEEKRDAQENSLLNLSEHLYKKYGKKVIILIDEYDTPLVTAHSEGYYKEAIFFFDNFLSAALKGNQYLEFAVLTGILRITKESIFSGLNNIAVFTILDNNFDYFGLTETEVESALKYYELDYELEEIKKWYNGYKFGNKLVYNPSSIIKCINNKEINPYWINTSDNALIKQLLDKNDSKVLDDLKTVFSGNEIEEVITENIVFSDLEYTDTIWSLMLFSGYLTYSKTRVSEITGARTYFLKIPNYEVKSLYTQTITDIGW